MRAMLSLVLVSRHATTERDFLMINSFRIFHPNNLKFSVKLVYTHMNNFSSGSFLSPKTQFVAKVRKKTNYCANRLFFLNFYKQSTI